MTEAEITQLIQKFETQNLPVHQWHHREHLIVATYYLTHNDFQTAVEKIRTGILKLNLVNGIEQTDNSGYHETLTVFLMTLIADFLKTHPKEEVVDEFKNFKDIVLKHYTREEINSKEARMNWLPPKNYPHITC